MAAYVVTGPLALVKDRAGKVRYYYQGAVLPDETAPDERDRLIGRGLVAEVAEPSPAFQAEPKRK